MDEQNPDDTTPDDREQREPDVLHIQGPGFSIRISPKTLKTIMDHTGTAWRWVVYALAVAIVTYSAGLIWSPLK
jgi:hypothetical protein